MKLAHPSSRYTETCLPIVTRPPKPPSWRDFLPDSNRPRSSRESGSFQFTDISQISNKATQDSVVNWGHQLSSADSVHMLSSVYSVAPQSTHLKAHGHTLPATSRSHKKSRNRLHRTRSEANLKKGDLPEDCITISLAETKPSEFGLRKTQFDPATYIEENTRRCTRWLKDVEASEPLEDIDFSQGPGVEVEMPDEQFDTSNAFEIDSASVDLSTEDNEVQNRHRHSRSRIRERGKHKLRSHSFTSSQKPNVDTIKETVDTKDLTLDIAERSQMNISGNDGSKESGDPSHGSPNLLKVNSQRKTQIINVDSGQKLQVHNGKKHPSHLQEFFGVSSLNSDSKASIDR